MIVRVCGFSLCESVFLAMSRHISSYLKAGKQFRSTTFDIRDAFYTMRIIPLRFPNQTAMTLNAPLCGALQKVSRKAAATARY